MLGQGKVTDGVWLVGAAAKNADLVTFYWFEFGSWDSGACDVFVGEVTMSLGTYLLCSACAG